MYILLAFSLKVCHTVLADGFLLSESNFILCNIVIRYKDDLIEQELIKENFIKENLIEPLTEKDSKKEY